MFRVGFKSVGVRKLDNNLKGVRDQKKVGNHCSKALGLIRDVEKDCLKVYCDKNLTITASLSRRQMLRFLAGHFDQLGFIAP